MSSSRYLSKEAWAWAEDAFPKMKVEQVVDGVRERFGYEVCKAAVYRHMRDRGIKRDSGRIDWTEERCEWFKSYAPGRFTHEVMAEHERVFGFPMTENQVSNGRKKLGVKAGVNGGMFVKGKPSPKKGKTWEELGVSKESQERSRRTCFKKGNIPNNTTSVPVGHERVDKRGLIVIKAKEKRDRILGDNWVAKQRVIWEEANGRQIHEGCVVVFADRDKRNFDPGNLVMMKRSEWCCISKNNIEYWDAESLKAAVAYAKLKGLVAEFEKAEKESNRERCKKLAGREANQKNE